MDKIKVVRLETAPSTTQVQQFVLMMSRMYDFHASLHADWQTKAGWEKGSVNWIKRAAGGDDFFFAMAYALDEAGNETLEPATGYIIASFHYEAPLFVQHRYGYIADLWVEEAYRGKAVGTALLETAYEWFRTQGVKRVQLEVDVENKGGQAFWKQAGFENFEIVMRKDI